MGKERMSDEGYFFFYTHAFGDIHVGVYFGGDKGGELCLTDKDGTDRCTPIDYESFNAVVKDINDAHGYWRDSVSDEEDDNDDE